MVFEEYFSRYKMNNMSYFILKRINQANLMLFGYLMNAATIAAHIAKYV